MTAVEIGGCRTGIGVFSNTPAGADVSGEVGTVTPRADLGAGLILTDGWFD